MPENNNVSLIQLAHLAEEKRCSAVVAGDLEALHALLDDDLVYCHTIGTVDTKQSYIEGIKSRLDFKSVKRADLKCRQFGTIVVMTGSLINTVRLQGDQDWIFVKAFLTQVWNCDDGNCRLVSFHGTRTPEH